MDAVSKAGSGTVSARVYAAPWAERNAAGELEQYGPSPQEYARRLAEYRNWAWKRQRSKESQKDVLELAEYMRDHGDSVPDRERQMFALVYEQGHAVRWVARYLGMSRATVRTYLNRLRARAKGCNELTRAGN